MIESRTAVRRTHPRLINTGWWELLILGVGYTAYSFVRNLAPTREAVANEHARSILGLERRMGIDIEWSVNHFFADHPALVVPANYFYALAFSISVVITLVYLWRTDRRVYRFHRTAIVSMTFAALITYWLYPLAPPRLMHGEDYIDTVAVFNTWGDHYVSAGESLSNQFAAMPSMHTGWSIWVGVALWCATRRRLVRVVATAFPIVTVVVIVGTANHFVLDAVAGAIYYAATVMIVGALSRYRRRRIRQAFRPLTAQVAAAREAAAHERDETASAREEDVDELNVAGNARNGGGTELDVGAREPSAAGNARNGGGTEPKESVQEHTAAAHEANATS